MRASKRAHRLGRFLIGLLLVTGVRPAAAQGHDLIRFALGWNPSAMHWSDLDGDGRKELITLSVAGVHLYRPLSSQPPGQPIQHIDGGGRGFLFDLADLDKDGRLELVTIESDGVFVYRYVETQFVRPDKPILRIRRRYVPARPLLTPLVRDLDGDGILDLIYPAGDRFRLFPGDGKGGFEAKRGQTLPSGIRITVRAEAGIADGSLESAFRIPDLTARDVDGDGRADLIAQLDRRLDIYRVGAGWTFAEGPDWVLDLTRFEAQGSGADDRELSVNFGRVNLNQDDLDGDGVRDFLIASGRNVWVFFAGKGFKGFERPDRILRVRDDVAIVLTGDVDEDGRPDLVLVKFEVPGMARLVASLLVGINLHLEALAYRNHGDRTISTKPDVRNRITFSVPPVLGMLSDFKKFRKRIKSARKNVRYLQVGDVTGDGVNDIGIQEKDRILLYAAQGKGAVAGDLHDPAVINRILKDLLFDTQKRDWDVDRLLDYATDLRYSLNRDQIQGQKPILELPLRTGPFKSVEFELEDLDSDGKADVAIYYDKEGKLLVDLYLTRRK